jgi:predicted component of type VI protein secretion system
MRHHTLFALLLVLAVLLVSGCTSDSSEDYYPGEDQALRITADALRIINAGSEPYTISYSVRGS